MSGDDIENGSEPPDTGVVAPLVPRKRRTKKKSEASKSDAGAALDTDGSAKRDDSDDASPAASLAVKLVELVDHESLIADDRGDAYVTVDRGGHRELLRLRGKSFRGHLAHQMYEREKRIPGSEAISSAVSVLEAIARRGPRVVLWNRVARGADGAIWIDLGDRAWRAIRVDVSGWRIINDPPALFRRFAHQAALPEPKRGGDLRRLLDFLNVASEPDAILLLCATVAALVPDVPQAVLIFHGPQGSAKTTAARLRRSLVDPSAAPTVIIRRDVSEIVQALDHHYMPVFDNLGALPEWMSNIFCQAATGGGFVKRELYSDSDDVLFVFRRPIIFTGVSVPATKPDLLDRSLLIRLERIPPEKRRGELQLYEEFDAARPYLVGALLDALVGAMRVYQSIHVARLPRLADFALWGAAAAEALGYGANAFFNAVEQNVARQIEEVLAEDVVAQAIAVFTSNRKSWSGSSTELLAALHGGRVRVERDWPKSASELGRRLAELAPVLLEIGVRAEHGTEGRDSDKKRVWRLSWTR